MPAVADPTGTYPRSTDTFIQREVRQLRQLGLQVDTFAVRAPDVDALTDQDQRDESARTTYLLPADLTRLVLAHVRLLSTAPRRYVRGARLALSTRAPGLRALGLQISYFAEAGALATHVRARRITHLHNHLADSSCTVAMLAAELGGFDFSFTLHGSYIFFAPERWRLDEKIRRAKFVACISHFTRSQAMFFSEPAAWSKLHVVRCGVDARWFDASDHEPGPALRMLHVGRLASGKGLPVLFESLRRLQERGHRVELILIGDGDDRSELERLSARLGIEDSVAFAGFRAPSDVREELKTADVVVLPSFAEGLPVSLVEAMAAGVPVVASGIAGIPELVDDGVNGFLVPPGDVSALTDRLDRLALDVELRRKMGQSGRDRVASDFDLASEVARLHRLLTDETAAQGHDSTGIG